MYTHVQHYQQAAAGMLLAKRLRQPMLEAFYRLEMKKADESIKQARRIGIPQILQLLTA